MTYRLYIDECGNSDLKASRLPNHRYLSLTGVILGQNYVRTTVSPTIEDLKHRYFGSHPDDPIILHRAELVNKRGPFATLLDPSIEQRFNDELLELLDRLDYVVITVAIDKLEHRDRYTDWAFDPYHYCLTVLMERYVLWLKKRGAHGDAMAESRGRSEDIRLKTEFERVFTSGTLWMHSDEFALCLTSKQLKMKTKDRNVAGLQLADLIAHPSFRAVQARHEKQALADNFGGQIASILEASKYRRSPMGKLDGWGTIWLP